MTGPVDWSARWVTSGEDGPVAPLLRGELDVPAGVVRAVVHVAGLGLHRTTLNGEPVSDARLESGFTAYDRRVIHSSYPVVLGPGRAVVGVELGRGFYAMTTPNVWGWHTPPWRGLRMARVQMELFDADDEQLAVLGSDTSWRWAPGGTLSDSLYEGETFDARAEPPGWDRPGFNASGWSPVLLAEPPTDTLVAQQHEPVRVVDSRPPTRWTRAGDRLIADFGTQLAGWVRVALPGAAPGTRVRLRFGERAGGDGVVAENEHVYAARLDTDEFVVGEHTRSWEPRFSYKGFRYVEVEGVTDFDQVELLARHAHNDVATVSRFSCSDEVLTWIDQAMRLTVRNNLHHLPTDTPVYEKNGWTGDVHVALETMLHQYDLRALLTKWLDDIADSQTTDGQLPVIVPTPGWGLIEAPEWTTLYVHLLDRLDTWYDVPDLVPRHLPGVLAHLDRELGRLDASGLATGVLGDYLAPGSTGTPEDDDPRMAASCYLVRALRTAAALVERSGGDTTRGDSLRRSADRLADAVNDTFLDRERGWYQSPTSYRQTANILPLAFGITPSEHVAVVVDGLVTSLAEHGNRHDAGALGLSELFGVLTRASRADMALAVATGRTAPSWGAWRDAGETTLLEMWNPVSRSRNHFFMGAMTCWLYEDVAGVRMLGPQWSSFQVDPAARGDLEHAAFFLDGPRGELGASWHQYGTVLRLEVVVPPRTTARIHLPGQRSFTVGTGRWQYSVDRGAERPSLRVGAR